MLANNRISNSKLHNTLGPLPVKKKLPHKIQNSLPNLNSLQPTTDNEQRTILDLP